MRQVRVSEGPVRCLAYAPDGTLLATGDERGHLRLWAVPGAEPQEDFPRLDASVEAVVFTATGDHLHAGFADGMLRYFHLPTRQLVSQTSAHPDGVRCLAWSDKRGGIASAGWDRCVRIWGPDLGDAGTYPVTESVMAMGALPPTDAVVVVGNKGGLWVIPPSASKTSVPGPPLFALAVAPTANLLATAGSRGTIDLWAHQPALAHQATLPGHDGNVYGLGFTPDGRTLVSGGADGTVCVWDLVTGRCQQTYRWHTSWVTCLAVAPDGMTAAAGSADGTLVIWDLDDGR